SIEFRLVYLLHVNYYFDPPLDKHLD
ncbi:MAG: hypothetical protein ACI8RD_009429, partial [Bacillariaceae sp.]